jgi:hypothetical protein
MAGVEIDPDSDELEFQAWYGRTSLLPDDPNTPSHGSMHGEPLKLPRKQPQMVTTCSRHKNEPLEGQSGQEHQKGRGRIMHGFRLFGGQLPVFRVIFLGLNFLTGITFFLKLS